MEIELKYTFKDEFSATKILEDNYLNSIKEIGTEEEVCMKAIYYDTDDSALFERGIAFRIRQENDLYVATVKWDGTSIDGLHSRQEINIPLGNDKISVDVEIFKGSPVYEILLEALGDKKLKESMLMEFLRKQYRIDMGKSSGIISLDTGFIYVDNMKTDIHELEIELYYGSQDDLEDLGHKLAEKYNLEPCDVSKYERGLNLKNKNV